MKNIFQAKVDNWIVLGGFFRKKEVTDAARVSDEEVVGLWDVGVNGMRQLEGSKG